MVTVHVNAQNVQVVDGNGAEVPSQTEAFWVIKNRMAPEEFLVRFCLVDILYLSHINRFNGFSSVKLF